MRKIFYIVLFAICSCFVSCSNDGKEFSRLYERIDSLENENERKDDNLQDLNSFVEVLADGLDSIAKHEELLFYTNKGKEGYLLNREQMKKNLEMFESLLNEQGKRISQLTDSLNRKGIRLGRLQSLVDYMNQQIEDKNKIIKGLRSDLENERVNVRKFQERVDELTLTNTQLAERVDKQKEALSVQSEIINECYVKIGTKKELTDLGVLSGGFFKKKKVNFNELNKAQFTRVDIRSFKEITIKSKHPKILTQMPQASYRLEDNGNMTKLYITDPTSFWSISNYLIIQTK